MPPRAPRRTPTLLLLASLLSGCSQPEPGERPQAVAGPATSPVPPSEIDPPAGPGSLAPRLTRIPEGGVLVSWLEPVGEGVALRWSALSVTGWTEPRTVVASPRLLANAADVPGVAALGDGRLVAHWRETREPAGAGYDARVALSFDHGRTWEEAVTPHRDHTDTEHGFVVVFEASPPLEDRMRTRPGGATGDTGTSFDLTGMPVISRADRDVSDVDAGLAWLDGRDAAARPDAHSAQLMTTTLESGGAIGLGLERVLDSRACDCCPLAAARAGDATLLAYRDRSAHEVRDIAVVRRESTGEWSDPVTVHDDTWEVPGCPVNGPALDAEGDRAAVAWFTASLGVPRVQAAFSRDGGRTWGEPMRIDSPGEGQAAGHAGVALLPDGAAVVSYVVRSGSDLVLRRRPVEDGGTMHPSEEIATGPVGIPQIVRAGDALLMAWTQAESDPQTASQGRRVRVRRWDLGD